MTSVNLFLSFCLSVCLSVSLSLYVSIVITRNEGRRSSKKHSVGLSVCLPELGERNDAKNLNPSISCNVRSKLESGLSVSKG